MKNFVIIVLSTIVVMFGVAQAENYPPTDRDRYEEYFDQKLECGLDIQTSLDMTKQNLHGVQLALERYAVDNYPDHCYPESIDQIVLEQYMQPGLYPNSILGISVENSAMDVPFGWSDIAPGNFTYLKYYDGNGNVEGYVLVAYGVSLEDTMDVTGNGRLDGVIITLGSVSSKYKEEISLPDGVEYEDLRWLFRAHGQEILLNFLYP